MEQNKPCVLLNTYNEDEIQVANILLDLPNLFTQKQFPSQFSYSFTWGTKKRRSNRGATDFSSSLQGSSNEIETTKIKAEVTSPATPLSFSPSESDDKSKHSSRKISKRKVLYYF